MNNMGYKQFRSAAFTTDWVKDYKPDIGISEKVEVVVGDTKFEGAVPDNQELGLSWDLCARVGSAVINKTV